MFLLRGGLDGCKIEAVDLGVATPLCMGVAQHHTPGYLKFIVYKGKHHYSSWTKGGAAGAMYSVSESGWMENETTSPGLQKCLCQQQSTYLPVVQWFFCLMVISPTSV